MIREKDLDGLCDRRRGHGRHRPRLRRVIILGVSFAALSGCITDKMVLINAQGQTKTCEFKGRVGLVSGAILHERFKKCLDEAKANGYKESAPAKPES